MNNEDRTRNLLALMNEVVQLRSALQAIVDFEPSDDLPEITHNPLGCADCQEWERRNHPIQHACDVWYRQYYQREDERKHREGSQHVCMRNIARRALDASAVFT